MNRPSLFNMDVRFHQSKEDRIASLNNQPNLDVMLSSTKERQWAMPARGQDNLVHVERNIKKAEDEEELEKPILQKIKETSKVKMSDWQMQNLINTRNSFSLKSATS